MLNVLYSVGNAYLFEHMYFYNICLYFVIVFNKIKQFSYTDITLNLYMAWNSVWLQKNHVIKKII